MRAAIDASVSTSDQNSELQLRELQEYAARQGWQITEAYQDVKIAQKVADDTGAKLVVIPDYTGGTPGAETYPDLMRTIAKDLVEAAHG